MKRLGPAAVQRSGTSAESQVAFGAGPKAAEQLCAQAGRGVRRKGGCCASAESGLHTLLHVVCIIALVRRQEHEGAKLRKVGKRLGWY